MSWKIIKPGSLVKNTRRYIRYTGPSCGYAKIDPRQRSGGFDPEMVGLIVSESCKGCGIIINATEGLQVDEECTIQLRELPPVAAIVRFRSEISDEAVKLGLVYLY